MGCEQKDCKERQEIQPSRSQVQNSFVVREPFLGMACDMGERSSLGRMPFLGSLPSKIQVPSYLGPVGK